MLASFWQQTGLKFNLFASFFLKLFIAYRYMDNSDVEKAHAIVCVIIKFSLCLNNKHIL